MANSDTTAHIVGLSSWFFTNWHSDSITNWRGIHLYRNPMRAITVAWVWHTFVYESCESEFTWNFTLVCTFDDVMCSRSVAEYCYECEVQVTIPEAMNPKVMNPNPSVPLSEAAVNNAKEMSWIIWWWTNIQHRSHEQKLEQFDHTPQSQGNLNDWHSRGDSGSHLVDCYEQDKLFILLLFRPIVANAHRI